MVHQPFEAGPYNACVVRNFEGLQPLNQTPKRADDTDAGEQPRQMFEKLGSETTIRQRLRREDHCSRNCGPEHSRLEYTYSLIKLTLFMECIPIFRPEMSE